MLSSNTRTGLITLLLALLSSISLAAPASQSFDARSWLDRMSHAFKEQNYRGVLIYGGNQRWETLQITHGVMDGVEYERLLHLTGEPREVIRKGHDITCIHPGEHVIRLSNHQNPLSHRVGKGVEGFVHQTSDIDAYYQLQLADGERIAGRDTQQVLVSPTDKYRYGYKLWLDSDTGLLLRSDLVDAQGRALERFQFADVEIGNAIPAADFEPQSEGHRVAAHLAKDEMKEVKHRQNWQLGWLPRGFMAAASQVENLEKGKGALATLMYTDGLAAITLFIDDVDGETNMPAMSQQWGVTAAVVRYLETDGGDYRITVVGEVPLMTVEKIAASVMSQ